MIRSRAAVSVAVCLLAVLPTAGCYQGSSGTVNTQAPTGNATDFAVGDLLVQDTTIVASPADTGRAAVIFTVVNPGDADDALTSVKVGGTTATIRTAPMVVRAGNAVKVGGQSTDQVVVTGLAVPPGSYAEVSMTFRNAGTGETQKVAVVKAEGYYQGYGPAAAVAAVK